ncbi:MAG: molybdopterin-synthase adenylyltransferase MoeB [Deltaproteobacteria bacterium]|nr:molybdopterin-synthase adenylyltransferase MoeB [Deltaproteobacteria bacterium]MBW2720665.1 molybdopterin-synthase adenylyltransferase MoeB [Deltaproteobacteria bacterium]RLA92297.1 MAG: adenylyltransferase [Deltaproteobacteria bacterium]
MLHFSEEQVQRYSRHIILPEVGVDGQEKLLSSRVLIAGMGGLGSPAALYLAAAGIGTFGLVDFDVVELSNLQRQVIHTTEDLGKPKVKSAEETIKAINPDATVHQYRQRIASETIADIITDYDLVLDGTDNFPTRFLLNDACLLTGKILVYGAVLRFDGQVSVFAPNQGPCYRCFIPEMPPPGAVPSCQQGGILGVLPGVIGILQATEAIKLLIGVGEPLIGRLLLFDALSMEINEVKLRRDPDCPACGERSNLNELRDYEDLCQLAV